MTERRTIGVHMREDAIEDAQELADEFDTKRATILRTLLHIGWEHVEMARDKDDLDKVRNWVEANEIKTAPEMTVDGNHPRWNPPDE